MPVRKGKHGRSVVLEKEMSWAKLREAWVAQIKQMELIIYYNNLYMTIKKRRRKVYLIQDRKSLTNALAD